MTRQQLEGPLFGKLKAFCEFELDCIQWNTLGCLTMIKKQEESLSCTGFLLLWKFGKRYDPKGFCNSLQKSIGKGEMWECSDKQS